jgi:hypothetical protein
MVLSTVQELKETGLIEESQGPEPMATRLGPAVVSLSLTPEDGLFVHRDWIKDMQAFVANGEMPALGCLRRASSLWKY